MADYLEKLVAARKSWLAEQLAEKRAKQAEQERIERNRAYQARLERERSYYGEIIATCYVCGCDIARRDADLAADRILCLGHRP